MSLHSPVDETQRMKTASSFEPGITVLVSNEFVKFVSKLTSINVPSRVIPRQFMETTSMMFFFISRDRLNGRELGNNPKFPPALSTKALPINSEVQLSDIERISSVNLMPFFQEILLDIS